MTFCRSDIGEQSSITRRWVNCGQDGVEAMEHQCKKLRFLGGDFICAKSSKPHLETDDAHRGKPAIGSTNC